MFDLNAANDQCATFPIQNHMSFCVRSGRPLYSCQCLIPPWLGILSFVRAAFDMFDSDVTVNGHTMVRTLYITIMTLTRTRTTSDPAMPKVVVSGCLCYRFVVLSASAIFAVYPKYHSSIHHVKRLLMVLYCSPKWTLRLVSTLT